MTQRELTKCPNCGMSLTEEYRKGNLMRCPACKTIFEIKLKTSQSLGKCPHGCGETIRIDDYVDDVKLQCVHCHGYAVVRTAMTNKLWDSTREEPPVLYKYLGKCPECQEPIADSDRDGSGSLACPHCNVKLVARSEYHVSEKIGDCPVCGAPLGKGDIGVADKCYCENCRQIVILDHDTRQIPEGDLFVFPDMTADEFKYKCFEQLFDKAPADIASKLEIQEVKLSFEPVITEFVNADDDTKTFTFAKCDQASIAAKFGGKVEFPATSVASTGGGTGCYLPRYELVYNYGGQRRFGMKQGDKEAQADFLPVSKRLTDDFWLSSGERFLIMLVILVADLMWWWNSSHGFFSGLWHLILAGGLFFIIFFLVAGPCFDAIEHRMRSRCQNRKVKEFLSYHGLDFSARNKQNNN